MLTNRVAKLTRHIQVANNLFGSPCVLQGHSRHVDREGKKRWHGSTNLVREPGGVPTEPDHGPGDVTVDKHVSSALRLRGRLHHLNSPFVLLPC